LQENCNGKKRSIGEKKRGKWLGTKNKKESGMEKEFANVISLQRERDNEGRRRVLDTYKDMLRHYRKEGVGERSKYAGCIIKQNMIDTLERRYKQLGGSLEDV
tara:strand:- start:291 stop:599 length:309 start_codon:yes stop_codon:yes gene_type:complete